MSSALWLQHSAWDASIKRFLYGKTQFPSFLLYLPLMPGVWPAIRPLQYDPSPMRKHEQASTLLLLPPHKKPFPPPAPTHFIDGAATNCRGRTQAALLPSLVLDLCPLDCITQATLLASSSLCSRKCLMKPCGSSIAFLQTTVIQSVQHLGCWRPCQQWPPELSRRNKARKPNTYKQKPALHSVNHTPPHSRRNNRGKHFNRSSV